MLTLQSSAGAFLLSAALVFATTILGFSTLHADSPGETTSEEVAESSSLIPDAGLEAAIRQQVFAKRDNQDPLTVEDLGVISRVEAAGQSIRSLEGLQHCRALMLLDLSDNEVSDLTPLQGLVRLQSLTLAGNQIENLSPLHGLTSIQLLDLSRNRIDTLDAIGKMRNLRTLYVADNRVSSIAPLQGLTKLSSLDLAGNAITDLTPIADSDWLTTLEISDNQVKTLEPLTGLPALSMLILPNNPIDSFAPLVKMCREDVESARRFAPYLKLYVNLESDDAKAWQSAIEELTKLGVSVNDYRRPTAAAKPTP